MNFRFTKLLSHRKRPRLCIYFACLLVAGFIFNVRRITQAHFREKTLQQLAYYKSLSLHNSSRMHSSKTLLDSGQSCPLQNLPLWNSDIEKYFEGVDPIDCGKEKDWVYTQNGQFFISPAAQKKHGKITCEYTPIINKQDNFETLTPITAFPNGSQLVSDAFQVLCYGNDGSKYENIHPCISKTDRVIPTNAKNMFNIIILGFDSLSRNMFKRFLPKSYAYFTDELNGYVLEGYNIIGDGTPQALIPMLTGLQETEVSEIRRGKPGAKYVDEALTFIWKRFADKGYITQWAEDEPHMSTFNLRMLGFKEKPVQHYMRPFYLKAFPTYYKFNRYCLGFRPRYTVFLEWLKEGLETNKGNNFFTFGFYSELSHNNNNPVRLGDEETIEFMKYLKTEGFLESTIFILMSDHGARHGSMRATEQGKLEERMPFFGFSLPASFKSRFPEKVSAMAVNTKRLVTPFDIHETLLEILNETNVNVDNAPNRISSSLFKEIPQSRTCMIAGIEPHWCACMRWKSMSVSSEATISAVNSVVRQIDNMLKNYTVFCHSLKVDSIRKAVVYENNNDVLKFKGNVDKDGRVADMSDNLDVSELLYQVVFDTRPGSGLFEATVKFDISTRQYIVNENDISRLNEYGNISSCITYKAPKLRPYCVCK